MNCLLCRHCYFSAYEEGFGEYTPGSDASLSCLKRKMKHARGGNLFHEVHTREQLREALHTAETCPDYSPEVTA